MIHKIQQKGGYVKFSDAEKMIQTAEANDFPGSGEAILAALKGKVPTSTTGLATGDLYSDSGTVKVKS